MTDRRPTAIVFAGVILLALLLLGCPTPVDPTPQTLASANVVHDLPVVVSSTTKGILTTDGSRLAAIFSDKTPATEYALLSAGGAGWSAHAVADFAPITSIDLYGGTVYVGGPSSTIAYGPVGGSDYVKRPLRTKTKPADGKVETAIHSVVPGSGEVLVATAEGLYCLLDDGVAKDAELIHGDEQAIAYYEIDARRLATGASGVYVAAPPVDDQVDRGVVAIDPFRVSWESSRTLDGLPALPEEATSTTVRSIAVIGNRVYLAVDAYGILELRWQ